MARGPFNIREDRVRLAEPQGQALFGLAAPVLAKGYHGYVGQRHGPPSAPAFRGLEPQAGLGLLKALLYRDRAPAQIEIVPPQAKDFPAAKTRY